MLRHHTSTVAQKICSGFCDFFLNKKNMRPGGTSKIQGSTSRWTLLQWNSAMREKCLGSDAEAASRTDHSGYQSDYNLASDNYDYQMEI